MKHTRRRGFAETSPSAADPMLQGRTYAIPFDTVWRAALDLTGGGLPRWTRHDADDHEGVILASSRSLTGAIHDVMVRITLDNDGQTRVDASAQARKPLTSFGRSGRRLRRLFKALDRAVGARAAPQSSTRT